MSLTTKKNKEIILRIISNRADNTRVAEWVHDHPIFCVAKIRKGYK